MHTYIIRRLILLIPVLIGISIIIFSLTRIGGNPAAAYLTERMTPQQVQKVIETHHFNDPILTQYFYWVNDLLHGDWGISRAASDLPVTKAIAALFPATFELALVSMAIAVPIGIYLGTLSAVRKDRPIDHGTRVMALAGVSLPIFVLGLMLLWVFYFNLHLFPGGGRFDYMLASQYPTYQEYTGFRLVDTLLNGNLTLFWDSVWHIILPAITLGFASLALFSRLMRSSMLEVMSLDYIKTARSKGLPERVVINKHARRNALIPTVTVAGMAFGALLGGAVLTETIFQWPGLGWWSTRAIVTNDSASIMGFVMLTALIYVLANLIVDVLYAYLDPRVKLG